MIRCLLTYFITLLLILQISSPANAQGATIPNCQITPAIWELPNFQSNIIKSNNLRRMSGSPDFAQGQFIDISGRILDSDCVPVTEAVVEIWQADSFGNTFNNNRNKGYDPNFAYSGTAITNNLGYYNFFTVFPGPIGKEAPHISFRIRHSDFPLFETHMYFPNNTLNDYDISLKNLVDKNQKKLLISTHTETKDSVIYTFNITLEGVNKYKRY